MEMITHERDSLMTLVHETQAHIKLTARPTIDVGTTESKPVDSSRRCAAPLQNLLLESLTSALNLALLLRMHYREQIVSVT
jgi:hypothetical protein